MTRTEQTYDNWIRGYRMGYSNERAAMAGITERIPLPRSSLPRFSLGFWDGRADAAAGYGMNRHIPDAA